MSTLKITAITATRTAPCAPPETSPATLPAAAPVTLTARSDGWSPERQAIFLRALASTQSVADAARAAGKSRQSAYALRARLRGEPFDRAWHAALQCRFDALAEAALERAMHGVEVPHYYKGEMVGTSRRYDERLTVALLAMRDRFGPPAAPQWHLSNQYDPGDFGALVDRVEEGPETWDEEYLLDREAALAECAEDEDEGEGEGEPDKGSADLDCPPENLQQMRDS